MPKEPNVTDKVLDLFRSKEWICVEDFECLFPPKTEGHMSWGQRKRDLHKKYTIIKRKKANCPHTWEYSLTDCWQKAVLAPKEAQGEAQTPVLIGNALPAQSQPEAPKSPEIAKPAFMDKQGQMAWIGENDFSRRFSFNC